MAETYTGTVKAEWLAIFINAALVGATTKNYVRLGEDLEEYKVEMGANVEKKKNILGKNKIILDGYEESSSVEPFVCVVGDPLFARLQDIVKNKRTHEDVKTTIVEVHLWEAGTAENTFVAYEEEVVIEVKSYGVDTSGLTIPFDLHYTGNSTKGTFSVATKTFTAD